MRDITVTFDDGTTHVYKGAPDDVTPEQVSARATKEFGRAVASLDGGRGTAPKQPERRSEDPISAAKRLPSAFNQGIGDYLDEADLDRMHEEAKKHLWNVDQHIARQGSKWWRFWWKFKLAFGRP